MLTGHSEGFTIREVDMWLIITSIAEWVVGLLIKDFKFGKSPEQKVKEADDAKDIKNINSIAVPDEPYIVRPHDDDWSKPKDTKV